jgi:two-component system, chemotaxis family, protein-glutamate methylesterase/glutaminase
MIKVLLVDDSNFIRIGIEKLITSHPGIQVSGTARNGLEALKFLEQNQVDVVILDFFMPKMNGIETLEHIMSTKPLPVIMITIANKEEHAEMYFRALQLGAFDIIPKPTGLDSLYLDKMKKELIQKIQIASISQRKLKMLKNSIEVKRISADFKDSLAHKKSSNSFVEVKNQVLEDLDLTRDSKKLMEYKPKFNVVIVGASTGGPPIVINLIKNITNIRNTALIIVQHMPSGFTRLFAHRLNDNSDFNIKEAETGMEILPGHGYVAAGDKHLAIKLNNNSVFCELTEDPKIWGIRPSIDYTVYFFGQVFKDRAFLTILTGMGRDGADAVQLIKKYGGHTYAQDPNEAMIDSMPKQAINTGCVDYIKPYHEISTIINNQIIK